jgi:uncharacterized Ntn-hydrolase superfamily protein
MLPRRPTHTYSIVAADPDAGELGIAVQSHWFCVGASVIWAEPGVGVMAVQADADPRHGAAGLAHLGAGLAAAPALRRLLQEGPRAEAQQLALADCRGGIAVHTGRDCIPFAGHRRGAAYAAQANMMLHAGTWDAIAAGFEAARGSLADRLLAALLAGETQGGDLRGRQSAALVVVRTAATGDRRHDRPVDLRVDDHAEPLAELARLLALRKATDLANLGFEQLWRSEAAAAAGSFAAAAATAPAQAELAFWQAWALVLAGPPGAAAEALRPVLEQEPRYAILLDRLAEMERRPLDAGLARLLDERRPKG